MDKLFEVIGIVLMILAIFGALVVFGSAADYKTKILRNTGKMLSGQTKRYVIAIILGFVVFGCGVAAVTICDKLSVSTRYETYTEKINSGYDVYANGIKVDADNVDLNGYRITYDDNNKKVLLTTK